MCDDSNRIIQRLLGCTSQLSIVNAMMTYSAEDANRILKRIEGEKAANNSKYPYVPEIERSGYS